MKRGVQKKPGVYKSAKSSSGPKRSKRTKSPKSIKRGVGERGVRNEREQRKREMRRMYHAGDNMLFELLERLRASRHRVTSVRRHIISRLKKAHEPKSIQELASMVNVDEVSVYRNIALFLGLGIVEEIALSGEPKRYALLHGHHDHIVCTACHHVEHIPCTLKRPYAPAHRSFKTITGHDLTFYGVCKRCE